VLEGAVHHRKGTDVITVVRNVLAWKHISAAGVGTAYDQLGAAALVDVALGGLAQLLAVGAGL
jgi:hypothetical protein